MRYDPDYSADIAVVTVNYNSACHTIRCVKSVLSYCFEELKIQVVVIDNGSDDLDFLRLHEISENSRVIMHRSPQNLGFAAANMLALQLVSPKYIFFLNNDCVLKNNVFEFFFKFMEERPACAMCCGLLVDSNDNPTKSWDYLPDVLPKLIGKAAYRITRFGDFKDPKVFSTEAQRVEVIGGCQMFIRSEHFNELGGFDCNFFLYSEEEDLAFRVKQAELEAWIVPEARVFHLGGGSTQRTIEIRREFLISFFYFYRKNYGLWSEAIVRLVYVLRYGARMFSDRDALCLAWFILKGPHLGNSLKHKQKIKYLRRTA